MDKKLYRYRRNSDDWMEAEVPLEYAACHDGLVILSGTLPQNPFNSGKSITIPEEIDGIPVTEIRTECCGIDNIDSPGLKRVNLKIYPDSEDFYCEPPTCVGGMQDTIEEMNLVFYSDKMHLGCFSDNEYLYSLTFNGVIIDNVDWDFGSFYEGIFKNCTNLKHIHGIMRGYTLSGSTFRNCISLETAPDMEIEQMCDSEFENCSSLKNIYFRNGLRNIGYHCFANCSALEDIYVPDTVVRISEGAFMNCVNLKTIHLPDDISEIPEKSFDGCVSLSKLFIPAAVELVGSRAFNNCFSLTDIFLPTRVSVIEDEAFLSSGLKTIHTSSNIKKLGRRAFAECKNLSKFFMPESVSYIGDLCFEECVALREMKLPKNAVIGDRIFRGCSGLEKVEIPIGLMQEDIVSKLGLSERTKIVWLE